MHIYFSLTISIFRLYKVKKILILNKISSATQKDFSMYFSHLLLSYLVFFVLNVKLPLNFLSDTQSQDDIFHKQFGQQSS